MGCCVSDRINDQERVDMTPREVKTQMGKEKDHQGSSNINHMHAGKELKAILISIFILGSINVFGQCDTDMMLDQCAHNLGTYNYIKQFSVKASSHRRSNHEYSYVFSKGSNYLLLICDQNLKGGKMIINLYDREHNLIASSFDEKENKYYPELRYACETTGVYYIKAQFEGSKGGCGMCILGFNKE